jgi:IS605 OrfB family transposase
VQRTIALTLDPNPGVVRTVQTFNEVTNFFLGIGFANNTHSTKLLQKLGYEEARKRWPALQSSLVQGARDCAKEMLKREKGKRLPVKKPNSSARFNQRTFKAYLDSGVLSLSTVEGRQKVPLRIPPYFHRYSHGEVVSLRVRCDHGVLRADLIVDLPDTALPSLSKESTVVGVDRGIINIAVTSRNDFFHSRDLRRVRGRNRHLRARLQAVGTRSAKRRLQRLSGRERRFQADVNHCIAKEVVSRPFDVLALEDLHIGMDKKSGRRFNRKLGGWAYAQLESFLKYKCEEVGRRIVLVPPEYTSKDCSRCGARGVRKGSEFVCHSCGSSLNADLNAARNIAYRGMSLIGRPHVNGPIVAGNEMWDGNQVDPSYKPPVLTGGN